MTKYFVQRCQSIYVYNLWPNQSSKFKVHVILGIHKETMLIKLRNNVNMMVLEVLSFYTHDNVSFNNILVINKSKGNTNEGN